jgi:hypothetical protein
MRSRLGASTKSNICVGGVVHRQFVRRWSREPHVRLVGTFRNSPWRIHDDDHYTLVMFFVTWHDRSSSLSDVTVNLSVRCFGDTELARRTEYVTSERTRPKGDTLILATIRFRRLSREISAHLTERGWTVPQLTALGDNLTLLFSPSAHDGDSIQRAVLEAADTLQGRIAFLRDMSWSRRDRPTRTRRRQPSSPRAHKDAPQ